jgi:cytochrome c oxidase assembly protein subunit 15
MFPKRLALSSAKYLVYLTGLSTYALIVWGGYTTLGGYGLGCGNYWPSCNGMLLPTAAWSAIVEYVHRVLTIVTGILLLISTVAVWRLRPRPVGAFRMLLLAIGLLIVQSLLGGDVVFTNLEPVVTTMHLAYGTAVFAIIVLACGLMYSRDKTRAGQSP